MQAPCGRQVQMDVLAASFRDPDESLVRACVVCVHHWQAVNGKPFNFEAHAHF